MTTLPRYRKLLTILLVTFGVAFLALVVVFHHKSEEYAVGEAQKEALNALLVHRAIHAYVTKIQRPEIYRLKDSGRLYKEYFSPQVMSFTYISRSIKDQLNLQREQHGMEPIYFKLASLNPRNPINQADALEAALLRRMNRDGLREYQDVVELSGRKYLYLAVPIERSTPGCMKCHGEPEQAPAELVAMYGDRAGFHESAQDIRALISIRAPLDGVLARADRMANLLTLVTFLVLAGIYAMIAFFSYRLASQQDRIVQQNVELARLSVTDALTGIGNRLGLLGRLQELASSARRFQHAMSVLMLDLDHFKAVNDRHGHPVGDAVLKGFAAVLRDNVRGSDIVGRWGGEEFLVIAPHVGLDSAAQLAEKLRLAVAQVPFAAGVRVTASIGVAEFVPGEEVDELITRVDEALYAAKRAGRNRVEVYRPAAGDGAA